MNRIRNSVLVLLAVASAVTALGNNANAAVKTSEVYYKAGSDARWDVASVSADGHTAKAFNQAGKKGCFTDLVPVDSLGTYKVVGKSKLVYKYTCSGGTASNPSTRLRSWA